MSRQARTAPPKAKFKRVCQTCLTELTVRIHNGTLVIASDQCKGES
jgi:hypothetical protein